MPQRKSSIHQKVAILLIRRQILISFLWIWTAQSVIRFASYKLEDSFQKVVIQAYRLTAIFLSFSPKILYLMKSRFLE